MKKQKKINFEALELNNLTPETEQQLKEKLVTDQEKNYLELIRIITFSGNVATKIIGLLDEKTIYRTVIDEFKSTGIYSSAIFLLTKNRKKLKIEYVTVDGKTLNSAEKILGIKIKDYRIDISSSPIFQRVVTEKKIILLPSSTLVEELVPLSISDTLSHLMGYEKQKIILAPLIRDENSIGVFCIASPELAEYFLPSANNLATLISDALQLCYEQKQRLKTEIDLLKEKSYLQTAYNASMILGSSGDFDEASKVIREGLDLGAVIIVTIDQGTKKAYTKGISVEMPDIFFGIIRQITFDLKNNKKAASFFDSLKSITYLTIDELFKNIINVDTNVKKLLSPVTHIIFDNKVGYIIAGPLHNSSNTKIGVFIFAKRFNKVFTADELPLVKSIASLLSISLENQIYQKKLIHQIIYNKFRADIWKLSADKSLTGDQLIQEFLNRLGPTIGLSRACYNRLIGNDPAHSDLECVIEWCDEDVKPSLGTLTPSFAIKDIVSLFTETPDAHFILDEKNILGFFPKKVLKMVKPIISFFKISLDLESMLVLYNIVNERLDGLFSFEICKENRKKPVWSDYTIDSIYESVKIVSHMISEQEADRALQKSEEKFRTFLETASDLMFITDKSGTIAYVNSSMARTLEYSRDELIEKHISTFVEEDSIRDFDNAYDKLVTEGEISMETIWCTKGATRLFGELKLVAIYNEKGDYQGSRGIFRDITERKKHEEERARFEARLRHFQKMETIGTLAGGIAHDFNNILSPIVGYIDMVLAEVRQNTDLYENLKHVHESAIRAKELVQQILTFSRKTEGNPTPTAIASLVKNYCALLRSSLPPHIQLEQHIDSQSGSILIDQSQVFRLMLNLCTNAQQAMEENGGILSVTLKPVEVDRKMASENPPLSEGGYVCLIIKDTGHGMNAVTIERIFEPYFTTREVGKGTGLGLSVVHGITKGAGGEIFVESKTGEGSTFTLYFPRLDITGKTEKKRKSVLKGGKERILFIDDEEQIVIMGEQMLRRLGYIVITTTNSNEAIRIFKKKKNTIDLVITDQTMPAMTGAMLIKELRHIKPDVPVILTSGFGKIISRQKTETLDIQAYLSKPMTIEELSTTVRKVLEERQKQEDGKDRGKK